MTELARSRDLVGTVTSFDGDRGLGTVRSADGIDHEFHCIEIADGTRSIGIGAEVRFDLLAKFGRYEAANLRT